MNNTTDFAGFTLGLAELVIPLTGWSVIRARGRFSMRFDLLSAGRAAVGADDPM
ncbi:hypothetical protein [Nocardia sp. NPDC003963]